MRHFKLGCNFDFKLIDAVANLNNKYPDAKITELYGSERAHAWLTARPAFRVPEVSPSDFKNFITLLSSAGVDFNYTMNGIFPGSKKEFVEWKEKEVVDFAKHLQDIGVKRITIANLIMADVLRNAGIDIKLEASTILHVDTVTQAKYLWDTYKIDKICGNLLKNRYVNFLKNMATFCNNNGMTYEVMVNEFCGVGGKDYATHCCLRDFCYLAHSTNVTKEDALSLRGFPMQHCIDARNTDLANWMRMRFIRPEDLYRYESIGISHFKITGRTGTTEYISKMAEAYMKGSWEGNLLGLWKPLETIYTEQKESEFKQPVFVDNKELDRFLDHWFDNPSFDCALEVCGSTCRYCHDYCNKEKQ